MTRYLVLLRGINVGGRNKLPMPQIKTFLEESGFSDVATYIQSGNALLSSVLTAKAVADKIESGLVRAFQFDSDLIKVLALSAADLKAIVGKKPSGFGDEPEKYHSDVIFLLDLAPAEAVAAFSPHPDIDTLWPGPGVIYHRRLSALRTKSRLNRMMATPQYKAMTIRTWSTTTKLLELMSE